MGLTAPGLQRAAAFRWVLPRHGSMRVPGVVFASEPLLPAGPEDRALLQVENVATLPGIVRASFAMPDVHWGYGFPIGGVAATDPAQDGVVSPGGVGFDISCGVRLLGTPLTRADLRPRLEELLERLLRAVPSGTGPGGAWRLDARELAAVLREGAPAAVAAGHGRPEDLERCEDGGVLPVETLAGVSARAAERGRRELGSLGSGNHFLEVQEVERVYDERVARAFGLHPGQVTVMIHCGSRGLGHQVCGDFVHRMQSAMPAHGVSVADPQLAAVPVESAEGRTYLAAMAASANFARANRQVLTACVRAELAAVFGELRAPVVYDVSHNLAKLERHTVDGKERTLCVHRKGATRALPAGHPDLPDGQRDAGQPVVVPGSMGSASYVLVGETGGAEAFNSSCHGAGRRLSRHQALRAIGGRELVERLRALGVVVACRSVRSLPEEAPGAYKDIDEVVRACEGAGLSRRVARLRPLGVLKG